MKDRPSHHELNGKLKKASEGASAKRIFLLKPDIIIADLLDLDYLVEDMDKDLPAILQEIKPENYRGRRPPDKSHEEDILDAELFAFRWNSRFFGRDMYIKFAIIEGALWIVSLHRDRSE